MRLSFSVIMLLFSALVWAEQTPATESGKEVRPEVMQMNQLAEQALGKSVRAIQSAGGLYPFGILLDESGKVRLIGYTGDPATKPEKEGFALTLFWELQKALQQDPSVIAAALVKQHVAKTKDGDSVPGAWVTVDHRDAPPWVVFLPFLLQENGKHQLGELVYLPTKEALFLTSSMAQ